MQALQLGVLADTSIHLSKLRELIVECGHEVVVAEQSRNFDALISVPHLDAWIVSLDLNTDLSLHVYEQIEESGVPVVFEDFEGGHMQAADRKKRFTHKISECIGWDKDPTSTVLEGCQFSGMGLGSVLCSTALLYFFHCRRTC